MAKRFILVLILLNILIHSFGDINNDLINAAKGGDIELVKEIIKQGADVNAKNIKGDTSLIYASMNGHEEIVKYLIYKNADVNVKNNLGLTPIIIGSWNAHIEIVEILIEAKANINEKDFDLLNPESIEKSIIFDSDFSSQELSDELAYLLQDSNFHIPGRQLKIDKKKKKKKKDVQEVAVDEFVKFNGFAELKDDKEDIGIYITIQQVSDNVSKVIIKCDPE